MPTVSSINVIEPQDLADITSGMTGDDVIIRQESTSSDVLKQTVKSFFANGPFTYFSALMGDTAPVVTSASSAILNLSPNYYNGLYAEADWWTVGTPESIVIPANGTYVFLVLTAVQDGSVDGQFTVSLVDDPAGTPTSVANVFGHTKGMGEEVSTMFFRIKDCSANDQYGIKVTNDGAADLVVDDANFSIMVLKIA